MSTIIRKDLLTAAIAGIAHFDNASAEAPATFIAFYLMGADDRKLIEMESPA